MDRLESLMQSNEIADIVELNRMIHDDEILEELLIDNPDYQIDISDKIQYLKDIIYEDFINGDMSYWCENSKVKISGPVLSYVIESEERTFILFGDQHFSTESDCGDDCNRYDIFFNYVKSDKNCFTIAAYLHELFQHDVVTDFFLETAFIKAEKYEYSYSKYARIAEKSPKSIPFVTSLYKKLGHLNITEFVFQKQLDGDRESYPYTRIHWGDVRGVIGNESNMILSIYAKLFQRRKRKEDYIEKFLEFFAESQSILRSFYLDSMPYRKFRTQMRKIIKNIENPKKLRRSLLEVVDDLYSLTSEYDGERIHKVSVQLSKIDHEMKAKIVSYIKIQLAAANAKVAESANPAKYLIEYDSLIMDAYILARMFKYSDTERVVVYAGYNHIGTYKDFLLTEMRYDLVETASQTGKRCLESEYLNRLIH